jgi:hypothetical protein
MKGDFSRSTFDPHKHYTSVRMQQGRVQLDADWNEQADILLHLITTQLQDLLGPGSTSVACPGFAITLVEQAEEPVDQVQVGQPEEPTAPARALPDFQIGAGRYYVCGIMCENKEDVLFSGQPDYPAAASRLQELADRDQVLVYLDVWQRHITAAEDPEIREFALGGPDTTTRTKTVWQVKLLPLPGDPADDQDWEALVAQAAGKGCLKAQWDKGKGAFLENRLYRVEIHSVAGDEATFKWSRENGSVVFPLTHLELEKDQTGGQRLIVQVEGLRDLALLRRWDWVEIVDDTTVLNGTSRPLCQVLEPPEQVDRVARVALSVPRPPADDAILSFLSLDEAAKAFDQAEMALEEAEPLPDEAELLLDQAQPSLDEAKLRQRHAILRRWDHRETLATAQTTRDETTKAALAEGALVEVPIKNQNETWLALERGIEVCFDADGQFRVGDYWLIPARAQMEKGILWPEDEAGQPLARLPNGIAHHYVPLALLQYGKEGWTVLPKEPTAFRSLPQLTANLSATRDDLETESSRLDRVQETVDTIVKQTHVFEIVKSEKPLEKGDLVSLDPTPVQDTDAPEPGAELAVKRASSKDGGMVVGVVSESIDKKGEGKRYRVVLYGRVRCKAIGDVAPGNLLVASAVPGHAENGGWYLQPGTIIGKALGSTAFDEGMRTGTVDMLVTLG